MDRRSDLWVVLSLQLVASHNKFLVMFLLISLPPVKLDMYSHFKILFHFTNRCLERGVAIANHEAYNDKG